MRQTVIETALALILSVEGYHGEDGDQGRAHGWYQIHDGYREDVNRIYGRTFTQADCYDLAKSLEMVTLYLWHYGSEKRLGREATVADLVRIHNGGPNGWRQRSSRPYLVKCLRTWKAMQAVKV